MRVQHRVLIGGLVVAMAAGAGLWVGRPRATTGLASPDPVHDFGTALETDRVRHTFTLRNTGREPVTIIAITSTCGCATAEPATRTLAPRAVTELAVDVDLRGRSGPQDFRLHVRSDCATTPLLPLVIRGRVIRELVPEPAALLLHGDNDQRTFDETVTLVAARGPAFAVTGVGVSDPALRAAVPMRVTGSRHPVVIRLDATREALPFRGTVTVQTDHPRRRVVEIPVSLMPAREEI